MHVFNVPFLMHAMILSNREAERYSPKNDAVYLWVKLHCSENILPYETMNIFRDRGKLGVAKQTLASVR